MNGSDPWSDDLLARLIAASRAEADPAILARALGRLESRAAVPAWIAWFARPAALAASCGLLVVSVGISSMVLRSTDGARVTAAATSTVDLASQLLDDDGALPVSDVGASPAATTQDSGGLR